MTDHSTLERRLRDAADPGAWDDVSPDAWQQNERRVAADVRRRRVRRLQVTGVAAAAAAVVALGAVALPRLGDHASPVTGTRNSSAGNDLNGGVEVARVRQGNGTLTVELALRPGKGGLVDLCDALVSTGAVGTGGSSTGCGGGGPDGGPAKGTHVAYLTGSSGGGVDLVAGTVDPQVEKVRGWTHDGKPLDANLLALNRGSYRGFAFLGLTAADRPELIDVLGPDEHILEVVDLRDRLGGETCKQPAAAQPPATSVTVSGVRVDVAASGLSVWVPRGDGTYDGSCVRAATPFPAQQVGDRVIALLPPEVTVYDIGLETAQGTRPGTVESARIAGTAWRIAVFDLAGASAKGAAVVLSVPPGDVIGRSDVTPAGG